MNTSIANQGVVPKKTSQGYTPPSYSVENTGQSSIRPSTPAPAAMKSPELPTYPNPLTLEDQLDLLSNFKGWITGGSGSGRSTGKILGDSIKRPIQQIQKVSETVQGIFGKGKYTETSSEATDKRAAQVMQDTMSSKTGGGDSMMGRLLSFFAPPSQNASAGPTQ